MKFQSLFRSVLCNSALETKHFCSPLPSYTHHRPTKNYHPAITTPVKNAFYFWGKATKKNRETKNQRDKAFGQTFPSLSNSVFGNFSKIGNQGCLVTKTKKTKGMMREKVNLFASSNHPDAQSPIDQRWIVKALFSLGWVVPDKWSQNASLTKKHYSLTNNQQINENKPVIMLIQKSSSTEISMVITSIIILILLVKPPCDEWILQWMMTWSASWKRWRRPSKGEQSKKTGPYSCLGYIGDYTQLCGDYFINHCKDPYQTN